MRNKIFAILICFSLFLFFAAKSVSAYEWNLMPVEIQNQRFFSGFEIGYQHQKLMPVVISNNFGAYLRAEVLGKDVLMEVYKTPGEWRVSSSDFSQGGAILFGKISSVDDLIYLPKGEYIIRVISGRKLDYSQLVFGPRQKP